MATSVKILKKVQPPLRWVPEAKDFTEEFLQKKASDPNGPNYDDLTKGEDCVLLEAQRILGRCLPPTCPNDHETGLVVGYVQSGKTMSFETVISLSRDNGYGIVIVLAGTKNNLKDQSEKRLKKDLGIDDGEVWHHFSNPSTPAINQLESKLSAWQKNPVKRKAVLITVLKQKDHLDNLAKALKGLSLEDVPVLIIDDEGDQASLNTKAAKNLTRPISSLEETSTIYDRICAVRDKVPHHSYLQYTATPQANLLLAQTDLLNPSFAELVTPGDAYTGGQAFFKKPQKLVVEIPSNEVPSSSNTLTASPKSLLSALRYFLLAAAHHAITRTKGKDRNRSMMVHPAQQTISHRLYKQWMDKSLKTLKSFVEKQSKDDPVAVARRFQVEYDSLAKTFPSIRPLSDLIDAMVEDVFNGELNCVEVNSTADAEKNIDWRQTPYWILIGGNNLDRGYTVEGLCSTYMPRALGKTPAADTLQQRARFFGYKKNYLGLCRVFVQSNVITAFSEYVAHEEFIRKELENARGKPLRDWRRDFLLNTMLRPTRPNVVGLGVRRILVGGWLVPRALQRDSAAVLANQVLLNEVRDAWSAKYGAPVNAAQFPQFKPAKGDSPNFIIELVPLRALLEDFFLKIQVKDPTDAEEHSAMLIAITELLRNDPDLKADVFLMNNLDAGYRTRDAGRGWAAAHPFAPINQYFSQSAGSVNDSHFCSEERVSLQLRKFNLGTKVRDATSADVHNVTWFALNVPKALNKGLVIEARDEE